MKLTPRYFLNFSFILEIFSYAFCLFLAIGTALNLVEKFGPSTETAVSSMYSVMDFIIIFILGTLFIYLILKYFKKPWAIRVLFYLAILDGLLIFSQAYFNWPAYLYFLIFIIAIWFLLDNVFMHNIVMVLAISSIAVIFGFNLEPDAVIIILIILGFYDFWAVYKSKYMVKMFQSMVQAKVHFSLIIPENFNSLFRKIKDVNTIEFLYLGTGDMAIPAIFVVSCLRISILTSLLTALGAILGFIILYILFILQKERAPMPGLPPIILGALFGYLISFLF